MLIDYARAIVQHGRLVQTRSARESPDGPYTVPCYRWRWGGAEVMLQLNLGYWACTVYGPWRPGAPFSNVWLLGHAAPWAKVHPEVKKWIVSLAEKGQAEEHRLEEVAHGRH